MNLPRLLLRLFLGRRLPISAGELHLKGPHHPITIRRDRWGVPHIEAQADTDAAFAIGFCHGQDRAGQLELLWRVGRGRLAEWVGHAALRLDRLCRRIGFRRAAELQVPVLGATERGFLASYAAGVNAGHGLGLRRKPHEFAILGGEPSRWDVADVLAALKLQAFLLPSNWDVELARLRLLVADGPQAIIALDPVSFDAPPTGTAVLGVPLDQLEADIAALSQLLSAGGGSNNWVVGGSRTSSGKPLLASDPHLPASIPAPWYLAHVHTPSWELAGATMVGAPAFPIGHNGFAAWGVTAGMTDNTDLFLETLSTDRSSVRNADGSFTACQVVRETIRVRRDADVTEEVIVTPRGPVIGTVDGLPQAISLRAIWLEPLPINGFLGVARARSFDEFRSCFAAWPAMPLNVVYADRTGKIGWQLVGQLPHRLGGTGLLPRVADQPGTEWAGLVPFEDMPWATDPDCGFLATANDPHVAGSRGSCLGSDYLDAHRAAVIRDELARRTDWDAAGCVALQLNTRSLPWEELRPHVLSLAASDAEAREGIQLLREWDGQVTADSPAAAVYELFVSEMCVRVARAKAPNGWRYALGEGGLESGHNLFADRRVGHLVRLVLKQPAGWFERGWPAEMLDVLSSVVRRLRREAGPSPAYWAWGHLRLLRVKHQLLGSSRLLGPAFNLGPIAIGGDSHTINKAGLRPTTPTQSPHTIPNLRAVFDLADLSRSTFVLCGGQSGNPCSPHYADQFPLWHAGEAITIPWAQDIVIREATATLRLCPAT